MREINPSVIKRAAQAAKRQAATQAKKTARRIRAEVVAKSASGQSVRIRQAHQAVAPQKFYPVLSTPYPLAVGDRIEGLIQDGGLVVLGRRLRSADKDIPTLDATKLARDGSQSMTSHLTISRTLGGVNRRLHRYIATDGDEISTLIDTDGGIRWRNETSLRDLVKIHRTGKMELLNGPLGLGADPSFPLEAATKRYVDARTTPGVWTEPTLLNGWIEWTGTPNHAKTAYRKSATGDMVHFRGRIKGGTITNGIQLFAVTSGSGCRPPEKRSIMAMGGNSTVVEIVVMPTGEVYLWGAVNNTTVLFDGLSFAL